MLFPSFSFLDPPEFCYRASIGNSQAHKNIANLVDYLLKHVIKTLPQLQAVGGAPLLWLEDQAANSGKETQHYFNKVNAISDGIIIDWGYSGSKSSTFSIKYLKEMGWFLLATAMKWQPVSLFWIHKEFKETSWEQGTCKVGLQALLVHKQDDDGQ